MTSLHFPDRAAFYEARGGERSGECDYGVWWRGTGSFIRYSLHIVHETGDAYLRNLHQGSIEVVATLATDGRRDCPIGRRQGRRRDGCPYDLGDRLLEGWTDHIHDEGSIGWVRWALQGYPVREVAAEELTDA